MRVPGQIDGWKTEQYLTKGTIQKDKLNGPIRPHNKSTGLINDEDLAGFNDKAVFIEQLVDINTAIKFFFPKVYLE